MSNGPPENAAAGSWQPPARENKQTRTERSSSAFAGRLQVSSVVVVIVVVDDAGVVDRPRRVQQWSASRAELGPGINTADPQSKRFCGHRGAPFESQKWQKRLLGPIAGQSPRSAQ